MKFARIIQIFLLLNIALSLISASSSHTNKRIKTSVRRRTLSKTKTGGISTIFTTLQAEFKKPANILHFVLGVLNEFIPGVKEAHLAISAPKADQYAKDCLSVFNLGKETTYPKQFSQMESEFNSPQSKKDFCEKTKDTIKDWYVQSHSEDSKNDGGLLKHMSFAQPLVFGVRGAFTSSDKLCEQILSNKSPRTHAEIDKKYNTRKEFLEQCKFFDNISCSDFNPEASGMQAFAKQCTTYYKAVNEAANCFKTKIPGGDVLAKVFSAQNLLGALIKNVASTVVNIMTFGVWGGLNGGYHLVTLALMIKEFLNSPARDTAFTIGGIVGRAMKIILSVSGIPTVRRRLKKKLRRD